MDEDDRRPVGYALPSPLLQAVSSPINLGDGIGDDIPSLMVQQWNTVGESQYLDLLVFGKFAPIYHTDLDLEGVARVHLRVPGYRRSVEFRPQSAEHVPQSLLNEGGAYG